MNINTMTQNLYDQQSTYPGSSGSAINHPSQPGRERLQNTKREFLGFVLLVLLVVGKVMLSYVIKYLIDFMTDDDRHLKMTALSYSLTILMTQQREKGRVANTNIVAPT